MTHRIKLLTRRDGRMSTLGPEETRSATGIQSNEIPHDPRLPGK